ncbi:MAG: acyltransferase family protein [Candidatus Bipolaricaulia bacterium]
MSETTRRYDIDWLRIIAMAGIFFLHCLHLFDMGTDWHLRNVDQSTTARVLMGVIDMWAIPFFFVLSGAGAWFALKRKSAGRFLTERVRRLLVPMYTVGLFAIALPQIYFDAFTNGYRGGFWQMIALNLRSVQFRPTSPLLSTFFTGHLWFLPTLFFVSVVVLPLLFYLRSESGQRFIDRVAAFCSRRGGIFLLAIPIVIARIALMSLFRGQLSWADVIFYAVLFLIGYVLMADDRFTESIKRHGWAALGLGIVAFGGEGLFLLALNYNMYSTAFSLQFILFQSIFGIGTLSWIVFLMSMGAKYLNKKSNLLTYASEAVLPFYIFHQTVILSIGWFVIRWNMGVLPKLLIVIVTSFAATLILYDAFVRHSNVMRFFFGMRPKKLPAPPAT